MLVVHACSDRWPTPHRTGGSAAHELNKVSDCRTGGSLFIGMAASPHRNIQLEQLLLHENEITDELVDSLLPWSETLPEELRVKVKPAT